MVRRPLFFYGWLVVAIATIGMMLVYGTRNSFSIFFPPILDEFGWSRGSTALMLSLNLLVYGFTAPVAGGLSDRWKPRLVVSIGIILLAGATAGLAFTTQIWHFYVLFGIVMPIGTAFSGWPVIGPAIANWFSRRRGLAMGFAQVGGGLSFTYGAFVEFVISRLGWRPAYFVVAGTLLSLYLPLYLFFFRQRPEKAGVPARSAAGATAQNPSVNDIYTIVASPSQGPTLGQAIRNYRLWALVASQALYWGLGAYLVLAHQVKYAQDLGYSSALAASIFGLFGIFMAAGQVCGFLSDRLGREKVMAIATVLPIVSLIALVSARDTSQPWLLYAYAIGLGYGAGIYAPTMTAGAADIFHGRHFGAIAGLILTGLGIGGIIGPWLGGFIYDITGSYQGAFIFAMVCFGLSFLFFLVAAPRKAARPA